MLLAPSAASAQLNPAFAGSMAQADNVATAASNPAALTRIRSPQWVVSTMFGYSDNEFEVRPGTTTPGGDPKNEADVFAVPSLFYGRPVGERANVGFSVTVPTGIGTDYGSSWSGRYFAESSSLVFVNFTPVVAYRLTDWLSLGAGFSVIYSESNSEVAINNLEPGATDGRMKLELDGYGFGGTFGALVELSEDTRLGFGYSLESKTKLEGRPRFRNLGPILGGALGPIIGEEVDLDMHVPQNVRGGFYHQLTDRVALMGDGVWIDFSEFGKVDIEVSSVSVTVDADYDDMWAASLGAEYRLSPGSKLTGGIAYVSSGVSDSNRTLALPWDEFLLFGAGFEHRLSETLRLNSSLVYVRGGDGRIDQSGPLAGRLVGKYTTRQTFLLNVSFIWDR